MKRFFVIALLLIVILSTGCKKAEPPIVDTATTVTNTSGSYPDFKQIASMTTSGSEINVYTFTGAGSSHCTIAISSRIYSDESVVSIPSLSCIP